MQYEICCFFFTNIFLLPRKLQLMVQSTNKENESPICTTSNILLPYKNFLR